MNTNLNGGTMRRIVAGSVIVLVAAFSRLLPHPPNVTALAAIALAGGVYFETKYAFLIPIAALVVSDFFLGFHATIPFVYGSFLVTVLIGIWLRRHKKPLMIAGGSLVSSVLFFLVTNFGVWLTGGGWYYPKTITGLVECYTLALPFFRNSLFGDLLFTAILFGLFELAEIVFRAIEKPQVEKH